MYNIIICIPTYKRRDMLEKLIISISKCQLNTTLINTINILIVDNDAEKSAEEVVIKLKDHFLNTLKIFYYSYSIKGLSNVRNELIKQALIFNPDYIVFVDDDEFVTEQWLNELVKTAKENNSDMSSGPVIAVFDFPVSKYISCWFNRVNFKDKEKIESIASGNLIIKVESLLKYQIRFDSKFNKTGSEDYYFGIQMMQKGATAFWAKNAIAYETIPEKRASLKWLIQRWFRGSSTHTYILNIEKNYSKIFQKSVTNLAYIFIGFFALTLTPFPIKRKYWGILKMTEGFGGILGLFNKSYEEYK